MASSSSSSAAVSATAVAPAPPKSKRTLARNARSRFDLARQLDRIHQQAALIRTLKKQPDAQAELAEQVFRLLVLKFDYCLHSPEPVTQPDIFVPTHPRKCIKLRWWVSSPDGDTVRLQRPVYDRAFITGAEVADLITSYTTKKFGTTNGFLKIELVTTEEDQEAASDAGPQALSKWSKQRKPGSKKKKTKRKKADDAAATPGVRKTLRALCDTDELRLDLVVPGPVLADETVFDLHVTWASLPTHSTCPASFDSLAHTPRLVDCGVNLFDPAFKSDLPQVVERALQAGVVQMMLISTTPADSLFNCRLAAWRKDTLYSTVGIHPLQVTNYPLPAGASSSSSSSSSASSSSSGLVDTYKLRNLILQYPGQVKAIGECGIDLSRGTQDLELQSRWLVWHLELAVAMQLPVFLHERDAFQPFVDIVTPYIGRLPKILVNCFTGTREQLRTYISWGAYIGLTGVLCNDARGVELRDYISDIPLNQLLIGSDAPYMVPFTMPKPFPKHNEPAFLQYVLEIIAQAYGKSPMEVAEQTTENARELFNMKRTLYNGLKSREAPDTWVRTAPLPYYGPLHPTAAKELVSGSSSSSAAASSSSTPKVPKEPTFNLEPGQRIFKYNDKYYVCSEKEHSILVSQLPALAPEAFTSLFQAFKLDEATPRV